MSRVTSCLLFALALLEPVHAAAPPRIRRDLDGDLLPAGAVSRLGSPRWRCAGAFMDVPQFSPDGRHLVSNPRNESQLLLWDAATGRLQSEVPLPDEFKLTDIEWAILPDRKRLVAIATRSLDPNVMVLLEFPSGKLLRRWPLEQRTGLLNPEKDGWVTFHLAVSPDGRLAACGDHRGTVRLYDLRTGKSLPPIELGKTPIESLAFTSDGRLTIAQGIRQDTTPITRLNTISQVHLTTRRTLRSFEIVSRKYLFLSPTGRHVASVTCKGLCVWDTETQDERVLLPGAASLSLFLWNFSADGRTLLAGTRQEGLLWFWDVGRGELEHRLRLSTLPRRVNGYVLSPDRESVLVPCTSVAVRLDRRTGRQLDTQPGQGGDYVPTLTFTHDGRTVVAYDGQLSHWEADTGRLLSRSTVEPKTLVSNFRHRPHLGHPGGLLAALDRGTQRERVPPLDVRKLIGTEGSVRAMAFTPDGRWGAASDDRGHLYSCDLLRQKVERIATGRKVEADESAPFLSPEGRRLAVRVGRGVFDVYDLPTKRRIATIDLSKDKDTWIPDHIQVCGFRLEGRWLYTWDRLGVRAWDVDAKEKVSAFRWKVGRVRPGRHDLEEVDVHVFVSQDGRLLARANPKGVELYELASGQFLQVLPGAVSTVAFSPTLRGLALAREKPLSILHWDLEELAFSAPHAHAGSPTDEELWEDLAASDASHALRAAWRLAGRPGVEAFLARRLQPVPRPDPATVRQLLRDLGNEEFATRRQAEERLKTFHQPLRPQLWEALATATDLEQQLRFRRLLAQAGAVTPDWIRLQRAIFALEVRGSPEAREVIARLAAGAPGAWLTDEATGALRRLAAR